MYSYGQDMNVDETIIQEIYKCRAMGLIEDLIVIHGVGSHGHPPVLAHRLHHGFKDSTQLLALTTTQQAVNTFRMELVFFLGHSHGKGTLLSSLETLEGFQQGKLSPCLYRYCHTGKSSPLRFCLL